MRQGKRTGLVKPTCSQRPGGELEALYFFWPLGQSGELVNDDLSANGFFQDFHDYRSGFQPLYSGIMPPDKATEPGLTLSRLAYLGVVPLVGFKTKGLSSQDERP
jgi:hypothetical protein